MLELGLGLSSGCLMILTLHFIVPQVLYNTNFAGYCTSGCLILLMYFYTRSWVCANFVFDLISDYQMMLIADLILHFFALWLLDCANRAFRFTFSFQLMVIQHFILPQVIFKFLFYIRLFEDAEQSIALHRLITDNNSIKKNLMLAFSSSVWHT